MKTRQVYALSVSATLLALLAACGGSDYEPTASGASIGSFVASYNQGLASVQAMNSSGFADLFDDAFLDSGYTKAQVVDNIKADADSLAANAAVLSADSLFPMMTIQDATVGQCNDLTGVCTLTATYANPAPDGTLSTTTVPVRFKDGKFRLYGDQKATG